MRKFLGMLFVIGMIAFSYGLSGPEPILDPVEFVSSDVSQDVLPSFHNETVENWYVPASVPNYTISPISKTKDLISLVDLDTDDLAVHSVGLHPEFRYEPDLIQHRFRYDRSQQNFTGKEVPYT